MDFSLNEDLLLTKNLLDISWSQMADEIGVTAISLNRWINNKEKVSNDNLEKIYKYIFKKGINLNKINENLYKEYFNSNDTIVLFHGSKSEIKGKLSLDKCKLLNDFGRGFYCGESLEQSAMFVSNYQDSSIYIVKFNTTNLKGYKFNCDRDWMLAIAYYRNTLGELKNHKLVQNIIDRLKNVDYIIAPIADNKMYTIMDSFISGEITDEQCMHSLSITDLGYQYVFINDKALNNVELLHRGYLSKIEKIEYLNKKLKDNTDSENKVKAAKIKFRGKGHYIDEILV